MCYFYFNEGATIVIVSKREKDIFPVFHSVEIPSLSKFTTLSKLSYLICKLSQAASDPLYLHKLTPAASDIP